MAYPQYDITFQATDESKAKVKEGPIQTDGSHTFVLDVNGTQLSVELSHESDTDRTPRLILTFK